MDTMLQNKMLKVTVVENSIINLNVVCRSLPKPQETEDLQGAKVPAVPVQRKGQEADETALYTKDISVNKKTSFKAASISQHSVSWSEMNCSGYVLNIVKQGYRLEFIEEPAELYNKTPQHRWADNEFKTIQHEISISVKLGIIEVASPCPDQVLSPIFLVNKRDGSKRMILNLKRLNTYLAYKHFKMEHLNQARDLIKKDCYLASIDLEKAYYSIPIHIEHRKYLRFNFDGKIYQYTCLPNGLASAPRIFTKIMRVVFSYLRSSGFSSVVYLDDTLMISPTAEHCKQNVNATLELLQKLGFHINWEKSHLQPTKEIEFLGFILNSTTMELKLTQTRLQDLQTVVSTLKVQRSVTIRQLASVLGKIIAALPAYTYGKLYYRNIESCKIDALKINKGHYDRKCSLTEEAIHDLTFWETCAHKDNGTPVHSSSPLDVIYTDASLSMWGAVLGENHVGSAWKYQDLELTNSNINALEILAVLKAMESFHQQLANKTVLVRCDNTTAVTYINNMGGQHSNQCNKLAKELWKFNISHGIFLEAAHIAGVENTQADFMSRLNENTEWSLKDSVFELICSEFGHPDVDLFASKFNKKCNQYISWKKDADAVAIDAFTIDWSLFVLPYAFPPFSLLSQVTNKIYNHGGQTIVIVYPAWPAQTWYPALMSKVNRSIILPDQPFKKPHPLKNLKMMCGVIY